MLSKGAGEKKERVRERAKERERERERERSWQGVRTRFESAFRRKVWPFRLLPFVTFAASAPACKRAESCLRAQITVEPQLFVAVSFPPFFHSVRRHTRTPTTPMISRFGNRTCMYIYIVERRCIIALCTQIHVRAICLFMRNCYTTCQCPLAFPLLFTKMLSRIYSSLFWDTALRFSFSYLLFQRVDKFSGTYIYIYIYVVKTTRWLK